MRWRCFFLAAIIPFALALPATAGLFSKHEREKPTPAQRVPELIQILKSDPSEKKRESAAEELRQYDIKDFPEIVPALLAALQHDDKPDVRVEAAQTLGKLRPISQAVGEALEQAMANDGAYRVRWHVRMILWSYQKNGYKSSVKPDGPALVPPPGTATTNEPPLAEGAMTPPPVMGPRVVPAAKTPRSAPAPTPPPAQVTGPALTPP